METHIFQPSDRWQLTYDLALRTRPGYCPATSWRLILCPYVKRFCRESADRQTDGQTDGRTDETDSIISTAEAGGKKVPHF